MLTIRTNHNKRPILDAHEITDKERKEFDYVDWDKMDRGEDSVAFFRYRSQLYDLHEFDRISKSDLTLHEGFRSWDAFQPDSYFSGIVVKYAKDDYVIVGTLTS